MGSQPDGAAITDMETGEEAVTMTVSATQCLALGIPELESFSWTPFFSRKSLVQEKQSLFSEEIQFPCLS
jgi:hypothetical protein